MKGLTTNQVITIAKRHIGRGSMVSSAKLCLSDAEKLYADNDYAMARERALESLLYSVGGFHEDYQKIIFEGKPQYTRK